MASGQDWTAAENAVLVKAYLDMLRSELSGRAYSKTEYRRKVQRQIRRSDGAIEYKLQNVSYALIEINHPFINGYKPARNLQQALRDETLRQLDAAPDIEQLVFESLRRPELPPSADLKWSEAPVIEWDDPRPGHFDARRVDFVRLDAENRALGLAGERAVLLRERRNLRELGRRDLAAQVEHVSQSQGDGAGFDILSFTPEGAQKYIEVKTTRLGRYWPMLVTRNEVAFSKAQADRFHLYRVFDFGARRPGLYTLHGDVTRTCRLSPETYQAVPA